METKTRKLDGCINTYSGLKINLLNPQPNQIDIRDIGKGLAYKGHFGGQTPFYFSIAQHSTLVVQIMIETQEFDPEMLMLGLLHDASKAYIGDMVKPLKVHLDEFVNYENQITKIICEKFELNYFRLNEIKPFDIIAQDLEYHTFFENGKRLNGLNPDESYDEFMKLFNHINEKLC